MPDISIRVFDSRVNLNHKAGMQCPKCQKPQDLCVCELVKPLQTRLHVLILQHPQEPDKDLGTARLTHLSLPNSTLKIGLSWPNLKAALGRDSQPYRWAVLYLGSGVQGKAEHTVQNIRSE